MNLDYNVIGMRIQKMRKKRNITQEHLAEMTDLSVVYISNIECAKRAPTLDTVVSIVNALDCTVDELLDGYLLHTTVAKSERIEKALSDCAPHEFDFLMHIMNEFIEYLRLLG